jgi:hypothetical protein
VKNWWPAKIKQWHVKKNSKKVMSVGQEQLVVSHEELKRGMSARQ